MLARMQSHGNSDSLLVETQNGTPASEDSLAASYKAKRSLKYQPAIPLLHIYPIEVELCPHKTLHTVCKDLFKIT